jgi:tRNA modification GTPase
MDTIFAQASKFGKAGIAVFRISGSLSLYVINRLLLNTAKEEPLNPRYSYYQKIYHPKSLEKIDEVITVYFKSPHSFTGEDVVEIYTHGSIAIIKLLTDAVLGIEGVRHAEPGEFARRAFLNGKFDLTAAEGLADLIEAETEFQHKQALSQTEGTLRKFYDKLRKDLLRLMSLIEAYIDFPDEEIPESVLTEIGYALEKTTERIKAHLNDNRRGEILRNGISLSIIGAPNAGKSSLINLLCQREVAIVSEVPGTTRDVIETCLDIGGYPIILSDTAGIRESENDLIEREGIDRAIKKAASSDIRILVIDSTEPQIPERIQGLIEHNSITVYNKIDLLERSQIDRNIITPDIKRAPRVHMSVKNSQGLPELLKTIADIASSIVRIDLEAPVITRERHRHQIVKALEHLENCDLRGDYVLAAEDIRMATRHLSGITGAVTAEEVLGEIFANFCIGK